MTIIINDVLDAPALEAVERHFATGSFGDGSSSAGADAARVKRNEELVRAADDELDRLVAGPLLLHPTFQALAHPRRITGVTLARYRPGMAYGPHADDAIMGTLDQPLRCDLAVTVFISAPEDCDGGELVIRDGEPPRTVKAARGAAIVYPADRLHEVTPVTRGERRVAVAWVQSRVRSAEQRALLHDLWRARETLRAGLPEATVTAEVDRVHGSLVRMWSEA